MGRPGPRQNGPARACRLEGRGIPREREQIERLRRPRSGRIGLFVIVSLVLIVALGALGMVALSRGEVRLPAWALQQALTRLDARSMLAGSLDVGAASLDFSTGLASPALRVRDLVLRDTGGAGRVSLPELRMTLSGAALFQGRIAPRHIAIDGARLRLSRGPDGRFALMLETAGAIPEVRSLDEAMAMAERLLAQPGLAELQRVAITGIELAVADAVTGRTWELADGRLTLDTDPAGLRAELSAALAQPGASPARVEIALAREAGAPGTTVRADLRNFRARAVAGDLPGAAWAERVRAPLSARLSARVGEGQRLSGLEGVVELGPGEVTGLDGFATRDGPVPIDGRIEALRADVAYDESSGRLRIGRLTLDAPALRLTASGHLDLGPAAGLDAGTLIAQLAISRLWLGMPGVLAEPVEMTGGALDLRLTQAPLAIEIGQFVLTDAEAEYRLEGRLQRQEAGWQAAIDARIPALTQKRLMELWPVQLKTGSRRWMSEMVARGDLTDVTFAARLPAGGTPRMGLSFDFSGLEGRFMRAMPPILGARGYGMMTEKTFDLRMHEARLTAPGAPTMSLAGSALHVPDVRIKGGPGEISLRMSGPLAGALALLEHEPFHFLSKGGVPLDIATGEVSAEAWLRLPLRPKITIDEVSWRAEGRIADAVSDGLVAGKRLEAPALDLRAGTEGLSIGGAGTLGGVAVDGTWRQRFGPEHAGQSRVEGTIELSPRFLRAFSIGLPPGSVTGEGRGRMEIDLRRGERPDFRLVSDLNGLGLALPALNWEKPRTVRGRMEIRGRLGQPQAIDSLALEAAGLSLLGDVALAPGGALERVSLTHLRIDDWLDVPVDLVGRGAGVPPQIVVRGGTLDLRGASFGGSGGDGAGGEPAEIPLALQLDRLVITDGMALTAVAGDLVLRGGASGQLDARMNGGPPVTLSLVAAAAGTDISLTAQDAGAVLAAADILETAQGGTLELNLSPQGPPREFSGNMQLRDVRVQDAPVLAELLSAVSVVGLLDQLSGGGIVFSNVGMRIDLTPELLVIRKGSATGPSMGVSVEGYYAFAEERLDMQGVVTPIYMLNGILEQSKLFGNLFGSTRGEGVFGFNYRVSGSPEAPSVSVNPLSVLAPGILREIFRGPTPAPPGQ